MSRLAWVGLVAGVVGCSGAHGSAERAGRTAFRPGDAYGSPTVEALPSLDVAEGELTREMRMASLLSAESLSLASPLRPDDASTASIAAWSDQELKSWMRQKHERAEAARKELDRAAQQSHRQRVLAGALVGLVYEDVARALLSLPVPAELASEPEIAAMYLDLLRSQAAPYLVQAHHAYVACAGNAEQTDELRHWSDFCSEREQRLPPSSLLPAESGVTTTTVVRR